MSIIKEKRYLFPFVVFVAVIALLIGCFGGGKSDDGNVANLVIQKNFIMLMYLAMVLFL